MPARYYSSRSYQANVLDQSELQWNDGVARTSPDRDPYVTPLHLVKRHDDISISGDGADRLLTDVLNQENTIGRDSEAGSLPVPSESLRAGVPEMHVVRLDTISTSTERGGRAQDHVFTRERGLEYPNVVHLPFGPLLTKPTPTSETWKLAFLVFAFLVWISTAGTLLFFYMDRYLFG